MLSLSLLIALLPIPNNPSDPSSGIHRPTASAALFAPPVRFRRRNHGPGTSGGGSQTLSGETLREGSWAFSLRSNFTNFQNFSTAEARANALAHGGFDAVDHTLVETLSVAYGVTDDFELGLSSGTYRGTNFIDAEADGMGGVDSSGGDPGGPTDLWIQARYRLRHDRSGHVAALVAIKAPTGKDHERLASGELLEGSSQPSSGAFDFKAGLGYSRFLTARTTMDAGASYTLRTHANHFTVGDRADLGLDVAYRLTEDVRAPWNWSVFGEFSGLWLGKDNAATGTNPNSGGTFLFAGLGARLRVSRRLSITLSPSIPVHQDLNGTQDEIDSRISLSLTYTP